MIQFFLVLSLLFSFVSPLRIEAQTIKPVNTRSRHIFNYELLEMHIENNRLYLKGWAVLLRNQNLHGPSTHTITVQYQNNGRYTDIETESYAVSLSKDLSHIGYPACTDSDMIRDDCNYTYNNVGFKASLDLEALPSNEDYQLHLLIETHQTKKAYRTPLYFAQEKKVETKTKDSSITVNAAFDRMIIDVYYATLRVTSGPAHSTSGNHMQGGGSCSPSFGNLLYYKHNTRFNKVYDKAMYNGLITYYKVAIETEECFDQRRRVIEADSGLYAYIPSTFINYDGAPVVISKRRFAAPRLSVLDARIEQYTEYNPLLYASAQDSQEGDISSKIKVQSSNVNTRIPGHYRTCYTVVNSNNQSGSACANVEVVAVQTQIRYINKKSYPHAKLQLWGIKAFNQFLLTLINK